ncbi:MAG: TonB-dependent receptor [Chthoniobacteraceae bacterium]|nr:TonB-dependent receptor [Chthoniobacteraceae bacterium]
MNKFILSISIASLLGGNAALAQNAPVAVTVLDETVVTASPLGGTLFEQAQPVSVLEGNRLQLALQPTLGETLSGAAGVSSTYFGPAASRPIIRGLGGDRIRILQNGNNTIDASATSVDHAVSFDPVSVESIEVVRGPAALLYGSNAIGGVVNVLDNRIPNEPAGAPLRGSLESRYGSANTERGGAFTLEGGIRGFNWHLEGYKRAANDLQIPGFARSSRLREREPLAPGGKEARDVLPNSDLRIEGLLGGTSYAWNEGYFGVAYSGFHTNYGTVAERDVTIDMEQRRWDLRGAFIAPFSQVKAIKYSVGLSSYGHTEFEGALAGTIFENEGFDGRVELTHEKIGLLEGTIGYQTEKSRFSALGTEAFLPPVETVAGSAFIFEEIAFEPFRAQFGMRYDHISVDSESSPGFGPGRDRVFDNVSSSTGLIYTPAQGYAIALSTAFTQRAPTYQELFANGPHLATNAFEIGNANLRTEKALSIDFSLRKNRGSVTGAVSVFYNRFADFIGQFSNGEVAAGEEDDLPLSVYKSTSANFFGGEAEVTFHLLSPVTSETIGTSKEGATPARPLLLELELKADYVQATDSITLDPLPRIPPFRTSAALNLQYERFSAGLEGQYVARQNRTSDFELPTDSYFLINASIGCRVALGKAEATLYLRGVNLTNEDARLHTSFLKEIAPLGGRGVVCGMKLIF